MDRLLEFLKKRKDFVLYVLVMIVSLFTLTMENNATRSIVTESFMGGITSIQSLGSTIGTFFRDTVNSIGELRNLQAEYASLRDEVERYQNEFVNLEELRRENEALRTLLQFSQQNPGVLVPTKIIGKTPGSFSKEFIINKGANHGVHLDAPVVSLLQGERVLVGKIVAVSDNQSMVLPVFSNIFHVAARLSQSRYEGLVSGLGDINRQLIMNYVDRDGRNVISLGDSIITSGNESLFPPGLFIGTVTSVEALPWETSIRLQVNPAVPFSQLEYVFVLITQ